MSDVIDDKTRPTARQTARGIPADDLLELERVELAPEIEAAIANGLARALLSAGQRAGAPASPSHGSLLEHLPSGSHRVLVRPPPSAAGGDGDGVDPVVLLWEHPALRARTTALQDEIDDISQALVATLRQDLRVHEQVMQRAREQARALALPIAAIEADTDTQLARDLLRRTRDGLDALLGERLLRRFERYYGHDVAIVGLEQAVERLEMLPDGLEAHVVVSFAPGTWPGGRLAKLRRRETRIVVPLRACIELALMRSNLLQLTGSFKRLLAAREHFRARLRALHEGALAELELALEADDLTAPVPASAPDAPIAARVSNIMASLGSIDRKLDSRPVLERACAAVAEVEVALSDACTRLRETYETLVVAVHGIGEALHEAVLRSVELTSRSARLALGLRKLGNGTLFRARRQLSHIRGDDVERQQQRVRYHPQLRAFLQRLEARIGGFIGPLEAGTRADMAHHVELFATMREALALSRERLEQAFEKSTDERSRSNLRQLKRAAQRQLKRIYHTLERRVMSPLWTYYGADPLVALLEDAAHKAVTLPSTIEHHLTLGYEQTNTLRQRSPDHTVPARRRRRLRQHTVTVRTRDIVEQWVTEHDVDSLAEHAARLRELRSTLVHRLQEVWNIVRYNIEGAMAEADEALGLPFDERADDTWEKCRDMALGGMRRAATRLDAIVEELDTFHDHTTADFKRRLALSEFVAEDAAAAATFRGSVRFWHNELRVEMRRFARRTHRRGAALTRHGRDWLVARYRDAVGSELMRELLGLSSDDEATAEALDETPALLASPEVRLPPVYRRLFSLEPLQLDEFLVARDAALTQLERAHRAWLDGERRSVLVYGDPGSGKRSFLNCGTDRFGEAVPIKRLALFERLSTRREALACIAALLELELAPDDGVEVLAARIQAMPERTIVVIERLHMAFVRRSAGFEALQTLLMLIGRSDQKLLWIVSMQAHPFAVVQRLLRVSDAFSHVIPMKSLDAPQLERAVLARHELSGYKLRFVADAETTVRLRRELRQARGDVQREQAILGRHFYRTLHEASGGNVHNAIVHWLRAVSRAPDDSELIVSMVAPLEVPGLERFTNDHIFALAALLIHGELDPAELAQVLDQELLKSRMTLQFLGHRGLIRPVAAPAQHNAGQQDDEPRTGDEHLRVCLAQPMLKAVVRALVNRNIVHWPTP